MDMSVVEEEKPPCVDEVIEYAAEIHAHLREMEVSGVSKKRHLQLSSGLRIFIYGLCFVLVNR